ncbi:competence/damage-inducible protein A [Sphingobacterium deserti]|uniref:CinA-like protein n=1 Tax=Sphingobacterium deserti TaxID=1229276 RepID=A0A0B8T6I3_9SPHI|nr:competence/damage-inducible protein A [Sphingobacterium deserti]KGE13659.1 competence/damage-inducible protein CinA [Sphingobacterium deserti]
MKAEIITIGDEILNGQIVDTNSAWIAQQFAPMHISVKQISSIADTGPAIADALKQAEERADIIVVTGGLGPTKDDVTKLTAAAYFNTSLVRDPQVLLHVQEIFSRLRTGDMPEINKQQADVLANAQVLFNDVGTAPGMFVQQNSKFYFFLPGVPYEMKYLIEHRVLPVLRDLSPNTFVYNAHLLTVGIGESHLARQIEDIEAAMPPYIKLAYLPKLGLVRLRFTAVGSDYHMLREETDRHASLVAARLGSFVVANEDISFPALIVRRFTEKSLRLATAESCTGGTVAAELTAVAGASQMFQGGVVAYANQVKVDFLRVDFDTLQAFGAVSEQVVKQMAEGAKQAFGTDYAIATSGVAGPGGGSPEKPVGMVCIAVCGKSETMVKTYHFKNDRTINIQRATMAALTMLWNLFQKEGLDSIE